MMDAFIALPYLIYSLGRRGGWGGGQKQEEFKQCVANEGSSFWKTENLRVEDCFAFQEKKKKKT